MKSYKKELRKRQFDRILDMLEYYSKEEEYAMEEFRRYLKKIHSNDRDFEM